MAQKLLEETIGEDLRRLGWKLAVAESITGGLISHRLTNIPGSSEYYLGGITAYTYEAKKRLLGVKYETLQRYGAVSQETALEMVAGVRRALASDAAVAVTGIAGPGGSLPGKPVGLVWIAISTPAGDQAWQFTWDGDRMQNKQQTADRALELLHLCLLQSRIEAVEVSSRPDSKGRLAPETFSWHGDLRKVEWVGRRTRDALGEHILCRTPDGAVFTLFHTFGDGRWFVEKVTQARAAV